MTTYRTAQGKQLDFEALRLQNEEVRAVGNMNVNARGDKLQSTSATAKAKRDATLASAQQSPVTMNVAVDSPVIKSSKLARDILESNNKIIASMEEEMAATLAEAPPITNETIAEATAELTGLAAAVAKAKKGS